MGVTTSTSGAGSTYVPIATITGGGSSFQASFSSIPQTYTDLRLVISGRSTYSSATDTLASFFNGVSSGGLYSYTEVLGTGSSATTTSVTSQNFFSNLCTMPGASATSGVYGTIVIDILNYSNTTTYKSFILKASSTTYVQEVVGLYRSTSAISSLIVYPYNGPQKFEQNSTVTLYGIKAA